MLLSRQCFNDFLLLTFLFVVLGHQMPCDAYVKFAQHNNHENVQS